MRLGFKLLVVDDNPDSIGNSVQSLRDHLNANGFMLEVTIATGDVLSRTGLRNLARRHGKEFNLVAVDYNLGSVDVDGAQAAQLLRTRMRYTDMIFYSSVPGISLLNKLAEKDVAGVFISTRDDLDAALKGLAEMQVRVHCLALGGVDLTSAAGKMTMGVIAAVAEFERDLLVERTQAGLARAKAEGKKLGRPSSLTAEQQDLVKQSRAQGASLGSLAKQLGVSRSAIQRVS